MLNVMIPLYRMHTKFPGRKRQAIGVMTRTLRFSAWSKTSRLPFCTRSTVACMVIRNTSPNMTSIYNMIHRDGMRQKLADKIFYVHAIRRQTFGWNTMLRAGGHAIEKETRA